MPWLTQLASLRDLRNTANDLDADIGYSDRRVNQGRFPRLRGGELANPPRSASYVSSILSQQMEMTVPRSSPRRAARLFAVATLSDFPAKLVREALNLGGLVRRVAGR
jgi:hypothetical protein